MTLDIAAHRTILFQILKDFYADTTISPYIGFKGGTAALMFYGLDRFSVDLDFDLTEEGKEHVVFDRALSIAQKYGAIKEAYIKRFNLFIVLSYEDKAHNVKIEINRRPFGSRYEIKTYLGVSMQVMVIEDMFAHKLIAMYERMGKSNRDIYDVWFFLKSRFAINKDIVEDRAQMPFDQLVTTCIDRLGKMNDHHILAGVGELLTIKQKEWAKANLRAETISLLRLRVLHSLP